MPTFIKTGFWEKTQLGFKGWLNLDQLISSIGGSASWGNISGLLSNQVDLQNALNAKQNSLGFTAENQANKATNFSIINNTLYPSIQAVNDQITAAVTGLFNDRGNYNASSNLFPATGGSGGAGAILKGDIWTISISGTLGGTPVTPGQTVRALVNTPGQTAGNWAISPSPLATWGAITGTLSTQTDLQSALTARELTANKNATGGYVGLTAFNINFKNVANTFTSFFTNTNSAARTYTFQDRNGTIADNTDLAAKFDVVNGAVALTDTSTIDLTSPKHTLASSSATRTFTISYVGDDITIELTLSATSTTYTFPVTSLCVSEGISSGNNILGLSGVSGDKYIIAIKKIGTAYYVVSKNFGQ